jgi:hypothetical protein
MVKLKLGKFECPRMPGARGRMSLMMRTRIDAYQRLPHPGMLCAPHFYPFDPTVSLKHALFCFYWLANVQ